MRAILHHRCIFTAILTLAGLLWVQVQANEQPGNATEQVSPATTLHGYHEFDYKFEDRPDPFLPFLGDKSKRPEGEKIIVDPKEVLTGLRKFEAGQLKLVAVLAFQDKKVVTLEDVTGEGHPAEQGTLIGRHGVVTSIEKDKLVVTETYQTQSGRTVVKRIPLYMHQQE
uniref:pilus assembly protein PilP n=1 Tax=Candidatus Electrothrix sp. TaxID=2170559 RepID=UPI00405747A2